MQTASTRQDTSDCWRKSGDTLKTMAQQCQNRADSGMYDKDKDNLQKCAAGGTQGANFYYCVADGILVAGAQMNDVTKSCSAKYKMGQ